MRLFLYYAFCSVKNQIKKLCKTWFIIFLIACMLFGGIIGVGVGFLSESFGDGEVEEEPLPDEGEEITELTPEEKADMLSAIEGGIFLAVIVMLSFSVFFGDKSGSSIFIMPDVNLLFSAPMKPQSVLLFRLMNQILVMLFASIYFIFQIPVIAINLGLSAFSAIMIFAAWIFMVAYQKLASILVYTIASTHTRAKKYLRPVMFALLGMLTVVYLLLYTKTGSLYSAFKLMFSGAGTRYIPLLGWIKGLVMWSVEGELLKASISLVLLIGCAVLLAYLVWRIRADFYEEAMENSEKVAATQAAAIEGATTKRRRERPDKTIRDGLNRGSGADVFFFKALYNRKRFSHFGFLTKTAEFYLFAATAVAVILHFAAHSSSFLPIGLGLCAMVFFRSLGNPLAADMDKSCFVTIPESAYKKVLWSLLAGTLDCALNILPAVLVSAVIMGASPLEVLAYFLLAVAIDFYASNVMLFIEFSLPSSIALQLKQMVSIMFIYFGLAPIAVVVGAGLILGLVEPFLFIAAVAAIGIGAIFFAFSPLFIEKGRK